MKKLSIRLLLLLAGLWTGGAAIAQYNPSGKEFSWKYLSTDHVNVHFYAQDPVLAGSVARYAEEALYDLGRKLDYKPRNKYNLFLYLSPWDYLQSNQVEKPLLKEGGQTPLRHTTAQVLFEGTSAQLQRETKTRIAHMLLDEFYYGGNVQSAIQNNVLFYEPLWFSQGFPEWLGQGWTVEDELWVSDLGNAELLEFAVDGNSPLEHTLRKSVWYYIVTQYGEDKLSEIFYMTRLHRSAEAGVIHVLGITLKTLTERWREFIKQRLTENDEGRDALTDKADRIELPKGEVLLGIAAAPSGEEVAVCVHKNGNIRVLIYNTVSKNFTETGIRGGYPNPVMARMRIEVPMAWSNNGEQLAVVYFNGKEEEIAWYNAQSKQIKTNSLRPALERIYEISWSHDNSQVAVSGLRTGSVDIFVAPAGSNAFMPLTDDLYDDHNPVWSTDDQMIFYSSNQPQPADSIAEYPYLAYRYTTDVYRAAWPRDKEGPVQVTATPAFNEEPAHALSSYELALVSDEPGIRNLKKVNVFLGDSAFITNLAHGILHHSVMDSSVVFTSPKEGNLAAWVANPSELYAEITVLNTRLRHYLHTEYLQMKKAEDARRQKALDTVPKPDESKNIVVPPVETRSDTTSGKVKYYVFDEEDNQNKETERKKKINKNKEQTKQKKEPERPDFGAIVATGPKETGARWSSDHVAMRFGFDPVFKLNLTLEAGFKDLRGDQKLTVGYRPYVDLKSSDFYANYSWLKHRVDLHAGIERSSRFLDRNNYFFRYKSAGARIGASYALDGFSAVSGGLRYSHLRRFHLNPFALNSLDANGDLLSASLSYERDSRQYSETFVRRGTYLTGTVRNAFSVQGFRNNFVSATFDVRKYFPVGKRIVLATRVTGGWSGGAVPQVFYLGGVDDWLLSRFGNAPDFPMNQDISSFHYMEYVTPVRGFLFNARNGSKYFAANAELRLPISRMVLAGLNTNSPYNVELIPFVDFGTAWHEGNPLSQKNPISTEIIDEYPLYIEVQTLRSPFIVGFGSGFRLQVFGYSTRLDLAWGVEDYTLTKPRVHLSLGRNF